MSNGGHEPRRAHAGILQRSHRVHPRYWTLDGSGSSPRSKRSISGVASSVRPRRLAEINERRLGALKRFRNRAFAYNSCSCEIPQSVEVRYEIRRRQRRRLHLVQVASCWSRREKHFLSSHALSRAARSTIPSTPDRTVFGVL